MALRVYMFSAFERLKIHGGTVPFEAGSAHEIGKKE